MRCWLLAIGLSGLLAAASACKTSASSSVITAASSTDPSGPRESSVDGMAYPAAGRAIKAQLSTSMSALVRALRTSNSPALKCEPLTSASLNRGTDCTVKASGANDLIHCYDLYYRDLEGHPEAEIRAATQTSCTVVAIDWPHVDSKLAAVIAPVLQAIAETTDAGFKIGRDKRLACDSAAGPWSCNWEGFTETRRYEIPFVLPRGMPKAVVEEGAVNDDGQAIPAKFADVVIKIGDESIKPQSFKASDDDLAAFKDYMKASHPEDFAAITSGLADYREDDPASVPPRCREGELHALLLYTGEGYREINAQLRKLKDGRIEGQMLSIGEMARLKVMISAANCARAGSARVVARGADLSAERLAKYVVGKTVQEPAFTSTTKGSDVLPQFRGNTKFFIIKAFGTDLSRFSTVTPEDTAEGEILILPGALFKVGARDVVRETVGSERDAQVTRIFLLQIP